MVPLEPPVVSVDIFLPFNTSMTQLSPYKIKHFLSARFLLDFNIYSLWHSDHFVEGMHGLISS